MIRNYLTIKLIILYIILSLTTEAFSQYSWLSDFKVVPELPYTDVNVRTFITAEWTGEEEWSLEHNEIDGVLSLKITTIQNFRLFNFANEFESDWGNLRAGEYLYSCSLFVDIRNQNRVIFVDCYTEIIEVFEASDHEAFNLDAGWNLVSTYFDPRLLDVLEMFANWEQGWGLQMIKDAQGRFYIPEFDFNNIPHWDFRQGYFIKLDGDGSAVFEGRIVPEDTPIPTPFGWSAVAYFPEQPIDARDAFANIRENLVIAKDGFGNFYVPEHGFSNMGRLERGYGYMVNISESTELVWNIPDDENRNASFGDVERTQPLVFQSVANTGNNMSLLLKLDNLSLSEGEHLEIGALTAEGLCVGAEVLSNENMLGLAIWGDDPTTEARDGLSAGEVFTLRLSDGRELEYNESDLVYEQDGFVALSVEAASLIPEVYYLSAAYPNPFNSSTQISFDVPIASEVKLSVFDINGRLLMSLVNGTVSAGSHSITWDASGFATGVYFVKMETANGVKFVQKAVIVK